MAVRRVQTFDAHFHIIDPRYPLIANRGYLPEPFTVASYRSATRDLPVIGGAVVSGSFQGNDTAYLVDALARLGSDFVGVAQLRADVTDDEIRSLDAAGVRAIRFNLYRGSTLDRDELEHLADRVHDVAGWHSEVYLDAAQLPDVADTLRRLPAVAIDHLGMSDDHTGTLFTLVEAGVRVKATGFGRMSVLDPDTLMATIDGINPNSLLVGTDLPSTRARIPFQPSDLDRVVAAVGEDRAIDVCNRNARRLYGLLSS